MTIIPEYESAANNCVQYAEPQGYMVWNATCGHWASDIVFSTEAEARAWFERVTPMESRHVFTDEYQFISV